MTDSVLKAFAAEFAKVTDEAERARLLARVKMIASKEAPDEAFEPPIRTLGDYLATPIEIPPVLVQPFMLVRGGLNATVGRGGKGKTVMNLNRCLRWAAGRPLFDGWCDGEGDEYMRPEAPLRILIVENEGAAGMFHRQIGLMLNAPFLSPDERKLAKENILIWGEGGYSNLKFDDERKLGEVRAGIEKHRPDVVFVEPFRSLWSGEENSATEMNVVADALVAIATDYECAVQISHHERKSGTGEGSQEKMNAARGSSVLEGVVTAMENFEAVVSGEQRELSWSKSRHGPAPPPVRMEWVPESWWYKWVPQDRILDAIILELRKNGDEPMTISDLHEAIEEPKGKLRKLLDGLEKDGRVKSMSSVPTGVGGTTGKRYRLPVDENETFGGLNI